MATRAELLAAVRQARPDLAARSDTEIEAIVGAADPRYRDLFDRARGALPPERGVIPPPQQYEDNSPGEVFKERLLKSMPTPGVGMIKGVLGPGAPTSVDQAVEDIPPVAMAGGGIVGTAFGGPAGAVGMAGYGGYGGERLRQMIQRARGKEHLTPEEAAWELKKQTLLGAGGEFGGQAVGKGFEVASPALYKLAAKVSGALPLRLRREFPTVIEDAIAKGLPLASEKATARSLANVEAGNATATGMIDAAKKAGAKPLDLVEDILNPAVAEVGPKAKLDAMSGEPQSRAALIKRVQDIQSEFQAPPPPRPKPVPEPPPPLKPGYEALLEQQAQLGHMSNLLPSRLFEPTTHEVKTGLELGHRAMLVPHRLISGEPIAEPVAEAVAPKLFNDVEVDTSNQIKQRLQKSLNDAWRAQESGHPIDSFKTETEQALERAHRLGLEDRVPGLGDVNAQTQRDIGVSRLMEGSLERSGGMAGHVITGLTGSIAGGAIPVAMSGNPLAAATMVGIAGATKAATSPYLLSRIAIGLDRTASPAMHATAYRAMAEALRRQLEAESQQQQNPENQ